MRNRVKFSCLECSSELKQETNQFTCNVCSASYPVVNNVPIVIRNAIYKDKAGDGFSQNSVKLFVDLIGLPQTPEVINTASKILSGSIDHPSSFIVTESKQFPSRIKSTYPDRWNSDLDQVIDLEEQHAENFSINSFDEIRFCWPNQYLPTELKVDDFITVNFRIKNTGSTTISSNGDKSIVISGHWISEHGEEETHRTHLLIDLPPGAELTQPIKLQTPKIPGHYKFRPSLLSEHNRWFIGNESFDIVVKKNPITNKTKFSILETIPGYVEDHQKATSMLKEWIGKQDEQILALEIGGNFSPSLADVMTEFVNVDVDLRGLQFSHIKNNNILHVCADGFELPFPDESFDLISIFASLHHFPDPAYFLSNIKDKLKPNGKIAIMCEPVGHPFCENVPEEYLAELKMGVNEQSFSLGEYEIIFERSGLRVNQGVVHGGSLKALLEKY